MGFSTFTEAELSVADVVVNVARWRWSDNYSGPDIILSDDALSFNLLPMDPNASLQISSSERPPLPFGSLSFWPAGSYTLRPQSGGESRVIVCAFKGRWFRDLSEMPAGLEGASIKPRLDLKNRQLGDAMCKLGREILRPGFRTDKLVEALGLEIAVGLARDFLTSQRPVDAVHQKFSASQMELVTRYIENFSGYIPGIEDISQICDMSGRHFRRLFKETTDQTFHDYARDAWAGKAKALLRDPGLSFREIWRQFGFSSPSSFAIAFRRATGQTPTAYRRYHRNHGDQPVIDQDAPY